MDILMHFPMRDKKTAEDMVAILPMMEKTKIAKEEDAHNHMPRCINRFPHAVKQVITKTYL